VTFTWPLVLIALLLIPLAVFVYVRRERRRDNAVARFGNPALYPNLVPSPPGWRRHLPVALLLLALTALLVGAARPSATVSERREEATIMLAVDVSFSMAAKDVKPTRLAAAQAAADKFLDTVPTKVSVGVVSFGTHARPVLLPTTDRNLARTAIAALRPGEGTALGDGIGISLRAGGARAPGRNHPPLALLVLSDGAQTQGRLTPTAAARLARQRSVPVYTVALGTQNGVVVRPLQGGLQERIAVPPDPQTLHRISDLTGGEFFAAPNADQLKRVYERLASQLGHKRGRHEITSAFAGGGAILLLLGAGLSTFWFRRPL
jgi:Ca-activated chloride channel family protein